MMQRFGVGTSSCNLPVAHSLKSLRDPEEMPVSKATFHNSGHVQDHHEKRPHRRKSLQYEAPSVNDSGQELPAQVHRDRKRRSSLSVLSSCGSDGKISANEFCWPSICNLSSTDGSLQATLLIGLDHSEDTDLNSFRSSRACGMTPDTYSLSKPRLMPFDAFWAANLDAVDGKASIDASDYPATAKFKITHRSTTKTNLSCPQSFPDYRSADEKVTLAFDHSPPDPLAPSGQKLVGAPIRRNRPAPPCAPLFDPSKQLARINSLLSLHQSSISMDGPSAWAPPTSVDDFLDVECLLEEHRLDIQLEGMRCGIERMDPGMTFCEKFCEKFEEVGGSADQESGVWRSPTAIKNAECRVFGQPLSFTQMYASCVCPIAAYQHDLPIVVYTCVEELYRTGMTVSGLFRSPPDRARHNELIELFDRGPSFGRDRSLSKERTEDICALLRSYIDRLPHAIWHETLFHPMQKLCVQPSVLLEKTLAEAAESQELDEQIGAERMKPRKTRPSSVIIPKSSLLGSIEGIHARSSSLGDIVAMSNSLSSSALSVGALANVNSMSELPQIAIARAFFRLLPRAHLALLAYLFAFFTQLPLCPHNQLTIEGIADFFAVPLFLGKVGKVNGSVSFATKELAPRKDEARAMMVWILKRWSYISEGLFDAEDSEVLVVGPEDGLTSVGSSDDSESVQTTASDCAWAASSNDSKPDLQGGRSVMPYAADERVTVE